jgi:prepilin-type processing-associated H-X9-DG protein
MAACSGLVGLRATTCPKGNASLIRRRGRSGRISGGRGVELCPSLNYALGQFKLKAKGAAYGYGYNKFLAPPNQNLPPRQIATVARPSDLVLLADAAQINDFQAPASADNPMLEEWYYVDNTRSYPNGHFRHAQKANAVFCDGHVAVEKMVAGSLDPKMPSQFVGRLRAEILTP